MKTRILPLLLLSACSMGALEAAPMLEQWQWRNPLPQGNDLRALAYGNGRFVAVGDYGTILTSTDGVEWTLHSLEIEASINGIAYGNGTFVAVGEGDWNRTNFTPGADLVLTSVDGMHWMERPTGGTNSLQSVAYGNGLFVAVASPWSISGAYTNSILTSPDGVTWTPRNAATNGGLSKVTFGNGRFVALPSGDFFHSVIQTSVDGINWSKFELEAAIYSLEFGAGLWIAAGFIYTNSAYASFVTSSPDTVNWTVRHIGEAEPYSYSVLRAVAYGSGGFAAMGTQYEDAEVNLTLHSPDGLTWVRAPDLPMLQRPTSLLNAAGQFVAVGEFGNIATSPSGSAWTGRSRATSNNLRGLTYGNGTFVAVGNNGTNLVSTDGILWTGHGSGTAKNLREVTCAANQFVAVGSDGTIVTSPNGATWSPRASGTTEDLWDVAYGNGTFVTVGGDSGGSDNNYHRFSILTSSDGATWTTRLSDPNFSFFSFELHAVTFGNGRFVAAGRPGAILTSNDGITWTTNRNVPEPSAYLKGLAYGNGLFVAVGETTSAWTSTDGIKWQARPLPVLPYTQLDDVAFGDGAFVAVGDGGAILTSADGINWSAPHSRTSTNLRDVVYGAGSFVIVGNNDHILQSGTNASPPEFEIVAQPRNQLVRPGASVVFDVLAQGSGSLAYQWQRNGTDIPGANGASLALNDVQIDDSAYYSAIVSDGVETLVSHRAFLLVTRTDPLDSWSVRLTGVNPQGFGVAYGADRFVAVGGSLALTSADGAVWATNALPVPNFLDVGFGNGLFVACGLSGSIAISTNGSHWTPRPSGVPFSLNAVTYGGGRFVAVGDNSANVTTSPDGVAWTPAPLPTNAFFYDVTHGNGQFVAVGEPGRAFTSPDGMNWTSRNSGTNRLLYGVAYGNGQFVAVGPQRLILTSPDAVTWTARANPAPPFLPLFAVDYGHGQFVVLGNDGTTYSSKDGVIWTGHPAATTGFNLRNITAGPSDFVAVGSQIIQSAPLVPVSPYIVTQPRSKVQLVGTSYTLNVSASGTPTPGYQWRRNGTEIPGATGTNYAIASVQLTNEGAYTVDVINPFGSVASATAQVVAGVPAAFLQSPLSQEVVAGGSVTLSAVVTGRPPAFTYVWRYEGTPLRVTNVSSEPLTFHTYIAPSFVATQRFRVTVSNAASIGPGVASDYAIVRTLADTDGDGLPDDWENAFGFSPITAGDGTNDVDHDGLSNAAEYIAGTDPTNATNVLRLDSVEAPGGTARLRFTAVANKTYSVQSRTALDGSPWQRVADVAATASDRTVEIHDPFGAGGANRFYRLVTPRAP